MPSLTETHHEVLVDGRGVLEAPVVGETGELYFADVAGGGVWGVHRDRSLFGVVPHRKGIGGLARHVNGGFIVSGRNVAWKRPDPRGGVATSVLIEDDDSRGMLGFIDLVADAAGRVYVGSVASLPRAGAIVEKPLPGRLHLIDVDGRSRIVVDDIFFSNGLTFSPGGEHLFAVDSWKRHVRRYPVAPDGSLGTPTVIYESDAGVPDGATTASDGSVWIAHAFAGCIQVIDEDGDDLGRVEVGRRVPTSLCFGGTDQRDLYVTTAPSPDRAEAGAIIKLRSRVAGIPRGPARISSRPGVPP